MIRQRMNALGSDTQALTPNKTIIFVFLMALSCVYLPCGILSLGMMMHSVSIPLHYLIPAFALVIGGIAFLFLAVRRFWVSVIFAMLLFFLLTATQSPTIPAVMVSVFLSVSLGGFLCTICRKKYLFLWLLLAAVSYLGAYALCGDLVYSLIALIPVIAGLVMGLLHRRRSERSAIVALTSSAVIILSAGIVALILYGNGHLSMAYISETIIRLRDNLSEFMKSISVQTEDATVQVFDGYTMDLLVSNAFNMLPGYIVSAVLVVIYLIHSLQNILLDDLEYDLLVTPTTSKITLSVYPACLFIISYIMSLTTDSTGKPEIVSIIFANIFLILMPGLFIVGLGACGKMLKKLSRFGLLFIIGILACALLLSQFIIEIVAAVGAVYIIVKTIDVWAQKHYSKKEF